MATDAADRVGTAAFILSLREKGVSDVNVLRALETVPRDAFAPSRFSDLARADVALPLPCGQTMTSPTVVAQMLVLLAIAPGQRVLEIGTGSGWISALLARLGASVRSYERRSLLCASATQRIAAAGLHGSVQVVLGDGLATSDSQSERFDRIILNGTLPRIPPSVTSRLAAGGRLVGAVAGLHPRLRLICRAEDGSLSEDFGGRVRLAPLSTESSVEHRDASTEV